MNQNKETVELGRTYGGESAGERLARQRQQFMDAGLELFGTIGYRATTVRLLCKQAGLIDRYFYKNFTDTEDLLEVIYRAAMDDIQAQVTAALAAAGGGGPQAMVEAGLEAFFKAFENSRVARVCWLEVLGVSPRIDALYHQRIQQFAALLEALARSLVPQWQATRDEAQITTIALIGAISQSAMHWLLTDYQASRKTLVTAIARMLSGVVGNLPVQALPAADSAPA